MTELDYENLAELLYPNTKPLSHYFNKYPQRTTSGEVTRIAPSPTGYLHIGQLYQAVIHKMLALKTGGVYYCRLEDTDGKREVENAGKIAYDMLSTFNLKPDEGYTGGDTEIGEYGPYVQSERLEIYRAFAHELVRRGRAFPCFCKATNSKEEVLKNREEELSESSELEVKDPCRDLSFDEIKHNIDEGKSFALRLRSNGDFNKTHLVVDAIKGKKDLRENAKDDVLIKSNGTPVYAFAHVVDDTLMGTTTIVRGQEWYQSLPVHIELSLAFGFKPFRYAHTPSICVLDDAGNKRKISKRKDVFADVRFFLKTGYPVDAVVEYLLNIINSDFEVWRKNNPTLPYTDFDFSLKKMSVTNPMFDFDKLNDVSRGVISRYSVDKLYNEAISWAKAWDNDAYQLLVDNEDKFKKVLSIGRGGDRPRKDITYYSEIIGLYDYILPNFSNKVCVNLMNVDKTKLVEFLTEYEAIYTECQDNTEWFDRLKEVAGKFDFVDNKTYKLEPTRYAGNISDATKFVRIAITGKENSPDLNDIMRILGEAECKNRIKQFVSILK